MESFDIAALEKALSTKGRHPKEDVSIKPGASNQQLLNEAIRLGEDVQRIYSRDLSTRVAGESYSIEYGNLYQGNSRWDKTEGIPRRVFEQLIKNGKRLLKDHFKTVEQVIQLNPGLALEANLEGKTGSKVLQFAYDRRVEQINALLESRVSALSGMRLYLEFKIEMQPPGGEPFGISISHWNSRYPSVSGIEVNANNAENRVRLVCFITHFEQVEREINRQLDMIEIRKEMIK